MVKPMKKLPCKLCKEVTEDTINSRYGSKALGFIHGKGQYHDDECLIWVSDKDKVIKQCCVTCERERIYKKTLRKP
jgi:hypothetical protein